MDNSLIPIILTSITATAAIISPLVTALINNSHQMRLKKLEMFYDRKYNSYHAFFVAYSEYKSLHNNAAFYSLSKAIGEAMLISSNKTADALQELLNFISSEHVDYFEGCQPYFEKCITLMRIELQRTSTKKNI